MYLNKLARLFPAHTIAHIKKVANVIRTRFLKDGLDRSTNGRAKMDLIQFNSDIADKGFELSSILLELGKMNLSLNLIAFEIGDVQYSRIDTVSDSMLKDLANVKDKDTHFVLVETDWISQLLSVKDMIVFVEKFQNSSSHGRFNIRKYYVIRQNID